MNPKDIYIYILSNPDENNWRGVPSPFWNQIGSLWQIELLLYRLALIKFSPRVIISLPNGYTDARLGELIPKYNCQIKFGTRSLVEREKEIIDSLNPHHLALFFKVEHALVDYIEINELLSILANESCKEVQLYGFIPGTMPYKIVNGSGNGMKLIESNKLDSMRFGVEISDNDKIRGFSWIASKLGSRILDITLDELSLFLQENRTNVMFFGEEIDYETIDRCDFCGGGLDYLPVSSTLPINSFVPCDKSYYMTCRNCGLVHLNPRPSKNCLSLLYNSNYAVERSGKALLSRHKNWQWVLKKLPRKQNFSLLDVGGNSGEFGEFLDKTCEYHLTDINDSACSLASAKGILAFQGRFDEIDFPKKYDFITMFELLEHLPLADIKKYLYKAASLVKPGGSIFISTPNHDSILNDFGLAYAEIPYHYYLFSYSILKAIIETTIKNKEIVKEFCDTIDLMGWKEYWLRFALGKNKREKAKLICPDTWLTDDHLLIEIKL
ncbi:class I SAM-dependent methyltransferase [Moorella sulfitireducens]|uniref:class I SAM-dependent methyltransferase n=1 Tax=Neomoorella sulfitireducens TaxID=2972948 RepID=UPI0021ACC4B9|nr:class I SAM-dependent methyltransferase [Moorella sulfitireducens]